MRLTLRTMLACLDADDRLDPADADELTAKIEQSTYASELAQRLRRVVQHPKIGVPRLDSKGLDFDANAVAEYLDNVLAPERVGEFERQSLESDVRLAEVAACHQILVLVLEQPAEIEPALRERMYRMGAEAARLTALHHAAGASRPGPDGTTVRVDQPPVNGNGQSALPAVSVVTPKPKPEVPEYLRAGRRTSLWPLALAALLAFVVVGMGLRAMGPFDHTHPMAKLLGVSAPSELAQLPEKTPGDASPANDEKTPIDSDPAVKSSAEKATNVPTLIKPESTTDEKANGAVVPDQPMENTTPQPETTEVPATPAPPTDTTNPTEPPTPPEKDPLATPPAPEADKGVGSFVSEDQVLVRWNAAGEQWQRLTRNSPLAAGDELLVFPVYRPQVLLSSGVYLTLTGETLMKMGAADAAGMSHLLVPQGRFLAVSGGKADTSLALDLAGIKGTVVFSDVNSEVAVEVRNYLPPGANPTVAGSAVRVVRLLATRGKIAWQEGSGEKIALDAGQVRSYVGDAPGETTALPQAFDWVDGRNIDDIDRRAARDADARLTAERPLLLSWTEMADETERRAEARAMAIRSLAFVNQFAPALAALSEESQKSYWPAHFDALRLAIARGPETADMVYRALVKSRGEDHGGKLFRLLWGYSPEDLQSPEVAAELVAWLDVEELDYRVLAFENLRRITGATHLYQPQFPAARRRTPVAQWNAQLKANDIVYKTPPAPIQDPKPAAPGPMRGAGRGAER